MFVGEQPGDREDVAGRPFVGPTGLLFDKALAEARVERAGVYVTNAVSTSNSSRAASGGCASVPMRVKSTCAEGGFLGKSRP